MGNMTTLQILQGVHDWVLDKIDEETASFITKTVNDLVNYYTKTETYTKAEVQQIVNAIKQFTYEVVQVLPTASASTMNKIYLVPAPKSEDKNVKEEYITIQDGSTYSWEMLGTTSIDLSNYYTKGQTDSAISSALSSALDSYTTTADLTTLLAQKQDVIQDIATIRSGASAGSTAVQPSTLNNAVKDVVAESGVYDVSVNNDNTKFESLSALLSSANLNTLIPTDIRKGGMSIKFIQLTPATYSVVKTEGLTEQPTGTEVQEALAIDTGTYTAAQLSDFATLPATTGAANAVTYYVAVSGDTTTYTTWVITKATADKSEYVQYRYMGTVTTTATFTNVANWQGVDSEPVPGSRNLVESGEVREELRKFMLKEIFTFTASNNIFRRDFYSGHKYRLFNAGTNTITVSFRLTASGSNIKTVTITANNFIDVLITQDVKYIRSPYNTTVIVSDLTNDINIVETLANTKVINLKLIDKVNIISRLNDGEWAFNTVNKKLIQKIGNGSVNVQPSESALYRYNTTLYYYDGDTLIKFVDENVLRAYIDNLVFNDSKLYNISVSDNIEIKIRSSIVKNAGSAILDYFGSSDIDVLVETAPGIPYTIDAINKATGNRILIGKITVEDNTTGTNTIHYSNTNSYELINLSISGLTAMTVSSVSATLTITKPNVLKKVITTIMNDSQITDITWSSSSPVVAFDFIKGRIYNITNLADRTATFSLVNSSSASATKYNVTNIGANATAKIVAEENCKYIRCGIYNLAPSVKIEEILPFGEIKNEISNINKSLKDIPVEIDKDESYLAFNYGRWVYVNKDGNVTSSTLTCSTNYIPYNGGDIVVRGFSSNNANLVSYFSEDKTFLGSLYGNSYNDKIVTISAADVPTGTAYIRVTGKQLNGYSSNTNYINIVGDKYSRKTREFHGSYQFGFKANGNYEPGEVADIINVTKSDNNVWYNMYDSLVAQYPEYVTKINCDEEYANSEGAMQRPSELENLPIYMYRFMPYFCPNSNIASVKQTESNILRVFITTGTHPEYMAIYDCYKMMEAICSNWQNDDNLWDLRWNVVFYIMPVSGPWGCAHGSRVNYNGVDLNRNAPSYNWIYQDAGQSTFSGNSPASEYETKVWAYYMNLINPLVYIDHHNFGSASGTSFMYATSENNLAMDITAAHIVEMTMRLKKKFFGIMTGYNEPPLVAGYCASRETRGGTREDYGHDLGFISATFETSANFNYENGSAASMPFYSANACYCAVSCFVNYIIRLLKQVSLQCIPKIR